MAKYPIWAYRRDGTRFLVHNFAQHIVAMARCSHWASARRGTCMACGSTEVEALRREQFFGYLS